LVFVFALSVAWAGNRYKTVTIEKGWGDFKNLIHQGNNRIQMRIISGSLDAYMDEQGGCTINRHVGGFCESRCDTFALGCYD
jgi:hypothetical protein